jgi:hypothetical protein
VRFQCEGPGVRGGVVRCCSDQPCGRARAWRRLQLPRDYPSPVMVAATTKKCGDLTSDAGTLVPRRVHRAVAGPASLVVFALQNGRHDREIHIFLFPFFTHNLQSTSSNILSKPLGFSAPIPSTAYCKSFATLLTGSLHWAIYSIFDDDQPTQFKRIWQLHQYIHQSNLAVMASSPHASLVVAFL